MFKRPRTFAAVTVVLTLLVAHATARADYDPWRRFVLIGGSAAVQYAMPDGPDASILPLEPLVGAEVSWVAFSGRDQAAWSGGFSGSLRYDHGARGVEIAVGGQVSILWMLAEVAPVVVLGARRTGVGVRGGGCVTFGFASACGHVVAGTHGVFVQVGILAKGVFEPRPFRRFRVRERRAPPTGDPLPDQSP